ncbi:MAG: C25 family cysteine peptidase, partial [Bacteroidota bacterium]
MKKIILVVTAFFLTINLFAGNIEKTFTFGSPIVKAIGSYQTVTFNNTVLSGVAGEPTLPYQAVSLLLPPGESAISVTILGEEETLIPGTFTIYPHQPPRPISEGASTTFIKNEKIYAQNRTYPEQVTGNLMTQYLNGYAFALSTFTSVKYNPVTGTYSYYKKITLKITTQGDEKSTEAMGNRSSSPSALKRVKDFAQNPELVSSYPALKSMQSTYKMLIITPAALQTGFQPLINMYTAQGLTTQLTTTESISASSSGWDMPEKIRNYIKDQYQNSGIEYVLLGGNPQHVPFRGFFCHVISGGGYEDSNIPADLYFSGMDGDYDSNGNHLYGEMTDNPDFLPEVSVARFTVDNMTELQNMVHKTVAYQTTPVLGEMKKPFLVGEHLYDDPMTEGGTYLELLVNDNTDNGYFTHGIFSSTNNIDRLYDTLVSPPSNMWSWSLSQLLSRINSGKQFIHHSGHSNYNYMMRMMTYDITNSNFYNVNGIVHNYTLMYSHGCMCGGFDDPTCIAKKCVTIENFLVGGVFNSRYGWFNQGTSDAASEQLPREYISSRYNDTTPDKHLGTGHMISKIRTASYINRAGE